MIKKSNFDYINQTKGLRYDRVISASTKVKKRKRIFSEDHFHDLQEKSPQRHYIVFGT